MSKLSNLLELIRVTISPPKVKPLDKNLLGVNCFFNTPLGTLEEQADDIHSNLGLNAVRVLFHWDDFVQPIQSTSINFSFYDDILDSLPEGLNALVVLAGAPSWVVDDIEPIHLFVNYVRSVGKKYKDHPRVLGYQIGNEPNNYQPDNVAYDFVLHPAKYAMALSQCSLALKHINPKKLVTNAATTSVVQKYPSAFKYNKSVIEFGALLYVDVYSLHFYGNPYTNLLRPNGVLEYFSKLHKPIYVTEIGVGNQKEQEKYIRTVIPYLTSKLPRIVKFFIYQYDGNSDTLGYGLRNPNGHSSLYDYLEDK